MHSPKTFFVTAVTAWHRPIFRRESTAAILIDTLARCRDLRSYRLHEYVVMPDHVHALITPTPGVSLEKALEWVREEFSFRLGCQGRVWKSLSRSRSGVWFDDTLVRDVEDYEIFREHIRMNPVRSGLTHDAEEYRHSSAYEAVNRIPLDPMPAALEPAVEDRAAWPIPVYPGLAGSLPVTPRASV
jgi:putative transposase